MENKRDHSNVEIVLDKQKAIKLLRKPLFKQFKILTEDKTLFNMHNVGIEMDRPMYVGFTVLEYAKIKIYDIYTMIFLPRGTTKISHYCIPTRIH